MQPTAVFLPGNPMDRGAWWVTVHKVARAGHDLVTKITMINQEEWCPTLSESVNYTVHVILQARILKGVAFPFSSESSQPNPRD